MLELYAFPLCLLQVHGLVLHIFPGKTSSKEVVSFACGRTAGTGPTLQNMLDSHTIIHLELIQLMAESAGKPLPSKHHSGLQQHINNSPQSPHQMARLSPVVCKNFAHHRRWETSSAKGFMTQSHVLWPLECEPYDGTQVGNSWTSSSSKTCCSWWHCWVQCPEEMYLQHHQSLEMASWRTNCPLGWPSLCFFSRWFCSSHKEENLFFVCMWTGRESQKGFCTHSNMQPPSAHRGDP